ncbi:MAG: hypothetical protein ABF242_03410 [Flavobacteriales bacterium]
MKSNDIAFAQRQDSKIISEEPAEFNSSNLYFDFREGFSLTTERAILINNESGKPLVFVFRSSGGVKYYCVKDKTIRMIKDYVDKFVIYSGLEPTVFKYPDAKGEIKNGFKFNKFDEIDMKRLDKVYDFFLYKKSKNTVEITVSKEDVTIKEKF